MPKFDIECRHGVIARYRVEAETDTEAVAKLGDIDLFCEYSRNTFGPNDDALDKHDIKLLDAYCFSDPAPSGPVSVRRDWVVNWPDEDEEEA